MSNELCISVPGQCDCRSQLKPRNDAGMSLLSKLFFLISNAPTGPDESVNPFFTFGDPRFQHQTIVSHSVSML